MANGKIVYPSGADPGDQVDYTFPKNYDFEPKIGILDEGQDRTRGFDGTAMGYSSYDKKYFELQFTRVSKAQFDYFTQLYRFHCSIDLYMDGVNLDATVIITTPPDGGPEEAFGDDGELRYSFPVRLEEV